MPVTIKINGTCLSLIHKGSNHFSIATVPDMCKTPTPGGPVPIPYPNISQSVTLATGTTTVKGDKMMSAIKGSEFSISNGDQAGTIGGAKSNVFMKESTWILYSFDVKMDGKNTCRLTDPKFHNHENTVNMAGAGGPPASGGDEDDDEYSEYEEEFEERQPRRRQQRGNVSGNNTVQNAEFQAALKEAGKRTGVEITKDVQQLAHQGITGQGIGGAGQFEELVQAIMAVIK